MPKDFLQYRLNLSESNKYPDKPPKWDIAYRATNYFSVNDLSDVSSLKKFCLDIENHMPTFEKVVSSFFTGGPLVRDYLATKKMKKYLSCRFREDIFDHYYKCIGYITWDAEEYAYKLLNILTGSWFKKIKHEK